MDNDPWIPRIAVISLGLVAVSGMWFLGVLAQRGLEPTAGVATLLGGAVVGLGNFAGIQAGRRRKRDGDLNRTVPPH
jgi:hypothetical protein